MITRGNNLLYKGIDHDVICLDDDYDFGGLCCIEDLHLLEPSRIGCADSGNGTPPKGRKAGDD
jgi:hypothetical protein